ncbi:MAG: hypothetical protein RLZZ272_1500, partial [Actinomycetota bacterium]
GILDAALHVAVTHPVDDDARTALLAASAADVLVEHPAADPTVLDEARRRAYASATLDRALVRLVEPPLEDARTEPGRPDVTGFVDALVAEAVALRASDIHLEPDAHGVVVRLRIDGGLRERARLPRRLAAPLTSRIKVTARLDIAERRLPQDGRTLAEVDGEPIDVRVATMPTWYGERVVLRLLPRDARTTSLASLGMSGTTRTMLADALERPQGLVLVTGPTGSGKTTTLYAGLATLLDPTRSVLTLEDPIEMALEGAAQTQIEPRIGLTFATGLRHALRHDPDVLLVGEVRDRETAALAVEAAHTGHLVLATMHAVDAPSALARLIDLGAERTLLAPTLTAVVAQRLLRRVCARCAVAEHPSAALLARLGLAALPDGATPRRGTGCVACEGSGVLGRTVVDEVLAPDASTRAALMRPDAGTDLEGIVRAARPHALRDDALRRALAGEVRLVEALRATPDP